MPCAWAGSWLLIGISTGVRVVVWYKLQTALDFCLLILHHHISVTTPLSSYQCKGHVPDFEFPLRDS